MDRRTDGLCLVPKTSISNSPVMPATPSHYMDDRRIMGSQSTLYSAGQFCNWDWKALIIASINNGKKCVQSIRPKKLIEALVMILLILGTMAGCSEENPEEAIGKLLEKMGEAKTEEEVAKIAEKIERLEQKAKKTATVAIVKLDDPFTFWQFTQGYSGNEKATQFRITFKEPVVDKYHPYHRSPRKSPEQGKKYFGIVAKIENLGPRTYTYVRHLELKVDKGFIYRLNTSWDVFLDDLQKDFPRGRSTLEPEQSAWSQFWCQIPEDTNPVEVFGTLGGIHELSDFTKFRMVLPRLASASIPTKPQVTSSLSEKVSKKDMEKIIIGKWKDANDPDGPIVDFLKNRTIIVTDAKSRRKPETGKYEFIKTNTIRLVHPEGTEVAEIILISENEITLTPPRGEIVRLQRMR